MSKSSHAPFREYAGVLVATLIVASYVTSGFVIVLCNVILGTEVKFPGDWNAAMLSLSSASLGYLIGKQLDQKPFENQMTGWPQPDPVAMGAGGREERALDICPDCPNKDPSNAEPFHVSSRQPPSG